MASAKKEILAMGIAVGFTVALSEEEIDSRSRFEELISNIMKETDLDESTARSYADRYWERTGEEPARKIYAITCMQTIEEDEGWPSYGASKFMGYYFDKSYAFEAVQSNSCNIFENLYNYAVIEEIAPGLYSFPRKRWVFEYDDVAKAFHEIDEPKVMKIVANVL